MSFRGVRFDSIRKRFHIFCTGHPPSAFYIILSGTCLINAKELDGDGTESNQTVNELHEGEVFGEVGSLQSRKLKYPITALCSLL